MALKSQSEYLYWLRIYVRRLAEEGSILKLREICDELFVPKIESRSPEPLLLVSVGL